MLITLTDIKNCFGLPFGHIICSDDALKFIEDEENDLSFVTSHNAVLRTTCDSTLDKNEEEQILEIRQHS
jgi:hypothetical protein